MLFQWPFLALPYSKQQVACFYWRPNASPAQTSSPHPHAHPARERPSESAVMLAASRWQAPARLASKEVQAKPRTTAPATAYVWMQRSGCAHQLLVWTMCGQFDPVKSLKQQVTACQFLVP